MAASLKAILKIGILNASYRLFQTKNEDLFCPAIFHRAEHRADALTSYMSSHRHRRPSLLLDTQGRVFLWRLTFTGADYLKPDSQLTSRRVFRDRLRWNL